jgi:hypothetical protein
MNKKHLYTELIKLAKKHFCDFSFAVKKISYERKGILYSEMFFLYISSLNSQPKRIIESGRARGQSTLILSTIFPKCEIISIEHDQNSEDVKIAAQRLKKQKNIKLLFGDATKLLPEILENGTSDIVLIDGPKEYKAIRLALDILKFENVKKIFIHDMLNGSPERNFLENHIQSISCSDQPIIAKHTHKLDKNKKNLDQDIYFSNLKHYGYSLLCIHNLKNRSYILLSILSRIFQFKERIQRKLNAYGKKQSL